MSPAGGVVTYVDNTAGAAVIYILHSDHLMTRVSQLQTASVQPGAVVQTGSALGISSNSGVAIHFTVYYDNAVARPLSYLTFAEQRTVANRLVGALSPCN